MDGLFTPPRRTIREAILSLAPTMYWPMDEQKGGLLRDIMPGGWHATVTATNEVQTVTLGGTPTGGSFTLTCGGQTTGAINWSSNNTTLLGNVDTALEALSSIGTGGVTEAAGTLTAGIGTFTVTFGGAAIAGQDFQLMTADGTSLTGTAPTVSVAATTAGGPQYGAGGNALGDGNSIRFDGTAAQYAATSTSAPNPANTISMCIAYRTTDATAATRAMASRYTLTGNQASWLLSMGAAHQATVTLFQAAGATFATKVISGVTNDGNWHFWVITFDATTLIGYHDNQSTANSVSLTGSWLKTATGPISIGQWSSTAHNFLWPGQLAHHAIWLDRVLTRGDARMLDSAFRGGA